MDKELRPIYVLSRKRCGKSPTLSFLAAAGVPHFVVVEADEKTAYTIAHPKSTVLVLDPSYQTGYDYMDNFGVTICPGPGPVRNFIHDHARSCSLKQYWAIDDDISGVGTRNGEKRSVFSPADSLRVMLEMQTFCYQYSDIAMAGLGMMAFARADAIGSSRFTYNHAPICMLLIDPVAPLKWRGRLSEDLITIVDVLKAGWNTITFKRYFHDAPGAMKTSGGLTDIYQKLGLSERAAYLSRAHPNYAKVIYKYGHQHNLIDFGAWKSRRPTLRKKT
tara:strand:+ start:4576 stop:5403 length:828 start_codon:yes stop_codon:yes gene_type:complete